MKLVDLYKEMTVKGQKAGEELFQKFYLSTENWSVDAEEERRCKKAFSLGLCLCLLKDNREFLEVLLEAVGNVNEAIKQEERSMKNDRIYGY